MASPTYLLGLDVGTQSLRAALVDPEGRTAADLKQWRKKEEADSLAPAEAVPILIAWQGARPSWR